MYVQLHNKVAGGSRGREGETSRFYLNNFEVVPLPLLSPVNLYDSVQMYNSFQNHASVGWLG